MRSQVVKQWHTALSTPPCAHGCDRRQSILGGGAVVWLPAAAWLHLGECLLLLPTQPIRGPQNPHAVQRAFPKIKLHSILERQVLLNLQFYLHISSYVCSVLVIDVVWHAALLLGAATQTLRTKLFAKLFQVPL